MHWHVAPLRLFDIDFHGDLGISIQFVGKIVGDIDGDGNQIADMYIDGQNYGRPALASAQLKFCLPVADLPLCKPKAEIDGPRYVE